MPKTRMVTAAALAAAMALLASGCAGGGANGGAGRAASGGNATAAGPADMTPMGETGGDAPITLDQMTHAKPRMALKAMDHTPAGAAGSASASKVDTGRPGKVDPVAPVGGRPHSGPTAPPTPASPAPTAPTSPAPTTPGPGDPATAAPTEPAPSPAASEPGDGGAASSGTAAAPSKVKKKRLPVLGSPRIGRIFGQTKNNYTWYCSASVVPSHGKNLIVTAGHCLWDEHDGHLLSKDWTFVPGYTTDKDGVAQTPYGIYTVSHWWAYQAWTKHQNWKYDFAFMRLRTAIDGTGTGNVQDNVGAMGLEWSQAPKHTYSSVGYDAENKYGWDDGGFPYYRQGAAQWYPDQSQLVMYGRFLTGGASGGPWMLGYNHTTRFGYVDGVNSRSDRDTNMSSAYFGDAFRKLYYKYR